uniref:Mical-like 2a n=1 Tax=Lepisosteus oculatus TaxID=7918 RepID=W5LZ60_LEPOC
MAASIKALQQWCKIQCDGYRDVAIINMTTSFRDGLAFCALIHKHRPDLIDFDSLSKENVYENNSLAFRVADEELGIPALLDAEDMVALRVPDRLSILTYVSQYYNYFHGRSPIGGMAGIKRPAEVSKEEPSGKKNQPVFAKKQVLVESSNKKASLSSTCAVCKNHVHLVQRHLVDGKLYHRNCFKCKECSSILLSGTYKPGPEAGTYICSTHQNTQNSTKSPPFSAMFTGGGAHKSTPVSPKAATVCLPPKTESSPVSRFPTPTPLPVSTKPSDTNSTAKPWTSSAQKTQAAREKFFQSGQPTAPDPSSNRGPSAGVTAETPSRVTSPVSPDDRKDKARSFLAKKIPLEGNANNNNTSLSVAGGKTPEFQLNSRLGNKSPASEVPSWRRDSPVSVGSRPVSSYEPSPQAEDSSNEPPWLKATSPNRSSSLRTPVKTPALSPGAKDWRSKLKPVLKGASSKPTDAKDKGSSMSASEIRKTDVPPKPSPSSGLLSPASKPTSTSTFSTTISIPAAPSPDKQTAPSPRPSPNGPSGQRTPGSSGPEFCWFSSSLSSMAPVQQGQGSGQVPLINCLIQFLPETLSIQCSSFFQVYVIPVGIFLYQNLSKGLTSIPFKKESKGNTKYILNTNSPKQTVTINVNFYKGSPAKDVTSPESKAQKKQSEVSHAKQDYIPQEEILKELEEIEDHLNDLEKKGIEMEKQLRSYEGEEEEDALMVEWFNLIRTKQMYMRRESELVYIAKTQDLEEQQPGVEEELRRLLEKPEHRKTPADKKREEELMNKLVEIVNDRNAIIDGLDEDRLREREEDQQLNEMMQKFDLKKDKGEKKKMSPFAKLFKKKDKPKEIMEE